MKTKPFDLEAALAGAPVVTRDGRRVRDIHYDVCQIAATIEMPFGKDLFTTFTKDGRYFEEIPEFPLDLFMLDEEGGES